MISPNPKLLLCFLTAFLLAGCGTAGETESPIDAGSTSSAPAPIDNSTGIAYPALYRDLDLPELPGGVLLSTGRQTTSLRDGLSLSISTSMPISEVRDYYSSALGDLGWEEAPSRVIPGAPMTGLRATRDGITYMATITGIAGETQVSISVTEQ